MGKKRDNHNELKKWSGKQLWKKFCKCFVVKSMDINVIVSKKKEASNMFKKN